jgi:hypothetical protein
VTPSAPTPEKLPVVELDAEAVEADDVAGACGGAAYGVEFSATDLDAAKVVAFGRARSRGGLGTSADTALAVGSDADEIPLDHVGRAGRHEGAHEVDAVQRVAGRDVAVRGVGGTDLVVGCAHDANAVAAGRKGAVRHSRGSGRIDADKIAEDAVAVGQHEDAVASEPDDVEALDGAAAAAGAKRQAGDDRSGADAVQLNPDDRVVGVRLGVDASARL